jgi:hypothetical protein
MISPVEKPIITSICVELLVSLFTSWHKQCALVNNILVRYSAWLRSVSYGAPHMGFRHRAPTLFGEERSSHWKALLTLAKANRPSVGRSCSLLEMVSWTITRDMKDELLLVMLFLGFFRLLVSLALMGVNIVFPSPNAGAADANKGVSLELIAAASLLCRSSWDDRLSLGCS